MRLKQIKLAGFKSFVDPTAFEVPGQLVGVVGPNGCGKSNVIDAVRWVLGESKASELRGESMQDVIFNGSADRKPASRAAVELIFDNSLGRIGGHWADYAEISVKRTLTRDGQSTYLINNHVVRRRDVHDMFLGTGLGPRAYAIIGQGMISRIIEAKPDELRVFLEEAAGVSKYKERRRETEGRLSDTRENLTRVEDILRELDAQIDKLQRQAEVAQQYRGLQDDAERKQRMLWLVRRDEALGEQARVVQQSAAAVIALEAKVAELRAIEAEIEQLRSRHYEAGDEVHVVQGQLYDATTEVNRLEAEIHFVVESQAQLRERAASLGEQINRATREGEDSRGAAIEAARELEQAQSNADALGEKVQRGSEELPALQAGVREARELLDQARAEALHTRQAIELSATRRHAAEQQLHEAIRRNERLHSEVAEASAPDADARAAMNESLATARAAEQRGAQDLAAADAAWHEADTQRAPSQQSLREAEARLAQIEARIEALRQIQERVQTHGKIAPWLLRHGLDRLGRLWQRLKIEHGWETAVESVLRERVSALQLERLDHLAGLVGDAPPAKVSFFAPSPGVTAPAPAIDGIKPLLSMIHCNDAGLQAVLGDWLYGVYACNSIEEATRRRHELAPAACFITSAGHWVDRHSIQIYAPDSEQDGVLTRQFELENLERELRAERLLADEARDSASRSESTASRCTAALAEAREAHNAAVRRLAAIGLDAERLEQLELRATQTRERVDVELAEVLMIENKARDIVEAETQAFDTLDTELAERQQAAEQHALSFEAVEQKLAAHRETLRIDERDSQEASFANREIRARIERLQAQIEHADRLAHQAGEELAQVENKLGQLSDVDAREALQLALQTRTAAEQTLTAARERLEQLTQTLRGRDEQRLTIEHDQEPLRQRLTDLQLKEQAARLTADQFASQLSEQSVDEAAVRASFTEVPKASWLQGEVTRLGNAVAALGPVNLAALDELTQSKERKGFLDAQSADINEAITTLEDAIRKIDRETRELLQETYDTVNRHFGTLFPELFGGGDARLVLTGDEILDAGVQVMAHPPGKRNSSIHLLSGGEKALTAIALVFGLFQLNPAPFCLLDEVDAPLDDANTERYCDMVRRMSAQTQFVFITHNKIAMELAQQLIGVTMQERGVSRIVAVDLDAAAQLAEAA